VLVPVQVQEPALASEQVQELVQVPADPLAGLVARCYPYSGRALELVQEKAQAQAPG
jgi:hypothetical protein